MTFAAPFIVRALTAIVLLWPLSAQAADVPAVAAPERHKAFNAESFTLDNGLQIVVIPNHRAPVVTHMVWYKVGAADEEPGKSGIAHFLEHLMFKGSTGLAPGEFSETIRRLGGQDNAFTSQDYTAYFQSVPVAQLSKVMTMEAGRMRGLNPPEDEVLSERKVILEERRQRTDNDPRARFAEQLGAMLYVNHPYRKPVIGWAHEMAELDWAECKAFYDRWYAPNNAILVVSGDVTGAQVLDMAKTAYGSLAKVDVPVRNRPAEPPLEGRPQATLEDSHIREIMGQKTFRSPSAHRDKKASLALDVLAEIMGGGPTSRLYKTLVVEKKIATAVDLDYDGTAWDNGQIVVSFAVAPASTAPADAMRAIDDEIRNLIAKGVTETERTDAIARLRAEAVYARDSLNGPAMIFGQALASGMTMDDVEYWPDDIAGVTAADVQAAARTWLDPDNAMLRPITGYMMPEARPEEKRDPAP